MILHVVLYGYETWSLTLRKDRRLRALENRVLRNLTKERSMGGWRKLHNEELHDLYSSPGIIRIMKWVGHVA
jgi:hypothetical protein